MFGDPFINSKKWTVFANIESYTKIVLGSTPNTKNPQYWDGDLPWITPAELTDDSFFINDSLRHITDKGAKAAKLTKMPKGTVIFSTRAPIGKTAITASDMYCNQGFKNFICKDGLNNVYLYYCLRYNKEQLQKLGTGTTFKELSKKVVSALKIAIPPVELQNKFENVFYQADKSKLLCELNKSMVYNLI